MILLPSVTNEPPLVSSTENSSVFRSMTRVSLSWFGVGEDTTLFEQPYPARAAIGVKALPKGAEIEMDAVVVI